MLHDFRLDSNHVLLGAPNQIRITHHPISHPPSSSQHLAFISTIQQGYFSNNQTYTHTIAASIKPETLYHHSRNCVAIIRPQPPNKENATKHAHTQCRCMSLYFVCFPFRVQLNFGFRCCIFHRGQLCCGHQRRCVVSNAI